MSREIKFKGKVVDGVGWECGDLMHIRNKTPFIHFYDCNGFECTYEVMPETIVEYTGLKDKNGKEIYEGDIIEVFAFDESIDQEQPPLNRLGNFEVYYSEAECMYSFKTDKDDYLPNSIAWFDIKVIGNIYENPELLEG